MTTATLINWDDPKARHELIERIGTAAYNQAFTDHQKKSTVATVNGYPIRPVGSRFGRLFMICGTDRAFSTMEAATAHANTLPPATNANAADKSPFGVTARIVQAAIAKAEVGAA